MCESPEPARLLRCAVSLSLLLLLLRLLPASHLILHDLQILHGDGIELHELCLMEGGEAIGGGEHGGETE